MKLKLGSKIEGLRPEMLLGLMIVDTVFSNHNLELTITEVTGGTHVENSLHYKGRAVDIRSKHIAGQSLKMIVLEECKAGLTPLFYMMLESPNTANEHFHLEYDPK